MTLLLGVLVKRLGIAKGPSFRMASPFSTTHLYRENLNTVLFLVLDRCLHFRLKLRRHLPDAMSGGLVMSSRLMHSRLRIAGNH